jgi:hypothetical protein
MAKGGSKSQANQTTTTQSEDSRIVNESGLVARDSILDFSSWVNDQSSTSISSDSSTRWTDNSNTSISSDSSTNLYDSRTTYNTTSDPATVKAAFDYATNVDATRNQGVTQMLGWASELTGASQANSLALSKQGQDGAFSLAKQGQDGAFSLAKLFGETTSDLAQQGQDNAFSLAKLFGEQSSNTNARFQDNVMQAFDSARTTTPGGIDNKTMIILGVAAAGALVLATRKN